MIIGKIFIKNYDKISAGKNFKKLMGFNTYFAALSGAEPIETRTDDTAEWLWGQYQVGTEKVWAVVEDVEELRMAMIDHKQNETMRDLELSMVASKKPLAELTGFSDGSTYFIYDLPSGNGLRHFTLREVIDRRQEILRMGFGDKRELKREINLMNVAIENKMLSLFGHANDDSAYALFADKNGRCHRFTVLEVREAREALGLRETQDAEEIENA